MLVSARPLRGPLLVITTACVIGIAGCAGGDPSPAAAPSASAASPAVSAPAVTVADPWVKTAESGTTAAFGTFSTTGSTPVTVLSAQTSASSRTELHEVVVGADGAMTMRPKGDGFVIEPGTPHVLAPGGDHIMIMDLASPIRPGDQIDVTLSLSDGSTTRFSALAKETSGGEENYDDGAGSMHMSGGQGG
ncbi:copper chaperone PCu(A)C [Pseudonocardia xinjiangensis]|uniref:copper chaperone PCu(A)C n=1 Tax=Pseudonocardia xinjiangensis TaxID=75289 RepID=UPI003D8B4BD2